MTARALTALVPSRTRTASERRPPHLPALALRCATSHESQSKLWGSCKITAARPQNPRPPGKSVQRPGSSPAVRGYAGPMETIHHVAPHASEPGIICQIRCPRAGSFNAIRWVQGKEYPLRATCQQALGTGSVTQLCSSEEPGSLTQREGNQVAKPQSWSVAVRAATGSLWTLSVGGTCMPSTQPSPPVPSARHNITHNRQAHGLQGLCDPCDVSWAWLFPCSPWLQVWAPEGETDKLPGTRHSPGTDGPARGGKVWGGRRQEL